MKVLDLVQAVKERRTFGFFEDFLWYITAHLWTSLAADSGSSVACGNAAGGGVVLTTGATDNNEAAAATTNSIFTIAANKGAFAEVALTYSENATNKANIFAGFSSVLNSANMMVDDGAGPATSFSGFGIFKVDGGTVWKTIVSNGSTQSIQTSTNTSTSTAAQVLRIEVQPINTTQCEATFYLNGVPLVDSNNKPIKETMTFTSIAAMQAGVYLKAGGSGGEVVTVDYVAAYGLR